MSLCVCVWLHTPGAGHVWLRTQQMHSQLRCCFSPELLCPVELGRATTLVVSTERPAVFVCVCDMGVHRRGCA